MTTTTPTMTFTMGLPAAGKSTTVAARFAATHTVIDPDAVKEAHPDYDASNPQLLHAYSKQITEAAFLSALSGGEGLWVIDGTGTNAEKMVRKMNQAKAYGFKVELVYVKCTLVTSLKRNAARSRVVPEHVVREKALDISTSFEIVAPYADSVEVVNND